MLPKYLLSCIVTLLIASQVNPEQISPRDAFDTAEILLEDLSSSTESVTNKSLTKLALLSNEIKASSDAVLLSAEVELQEVMIELAEEVDGIRDEGEAAGADMELVEQCIRSYNSQLETIPTYILRTISICLNGTVTETTTLIQNSINYIMSQRTTIERFDLQIKQCRLLPDGTECIDGVIEQILIALIDLPARINEDCERTEAVVQAMVPQLQPCSSDRIETAPGLGQQIITYIRTCSKLP